MKRTKWRPNFVKYSTFVNVRLLWGNTFSTETAFVRFFSRINENGLNAFSNLVNGILENLWVWNLNKTYRGIRKYKSRFITAIDKHVEKQVTKTEKIIIIVELNSRHNLIQYWAYLDNFSLILIYESQSIYFSTSYSFGNKFYLSL